MGVSLCPKCEKLEVLGEREQVGDDEDEVIFEVYRLNCELRPITPLIRRQWANVRKPYVPGARRKKPFQHAIDNDRMIVDALSLKDPGPGLHHNCYLTVKVCLLCDRAPLLNRMHVRYIDLDDEEEFEKSRLALTFIKTKRTS